MWTTTFNKTHWIAKEDMRRKEERRASKNVEYGVNAEVGPLRLNKNSCGGQNLISPKVLRIMLSVSAQ